MKLLEDLQEKLDASYKARHGKRLRSSGGGARRKYNGHLDHMGKNDWQEEPIKATLRPSR